MRTKWTGLILSAGAGAWLATTSMASIVPISDDFSSGSGSIANWASVGTTATTLSFDYPAEDYDRNDLLNSTGNALDGDGVVGNLAGDDEVTGDGLHGGTTDGGLRFNTVNGTPGDEAIGLTIGGTMDVGEQITLTTWEYNDWGSYFWGSVQLYNLTDGTVLIDSGNRYVKGNSDTTYVPVETVLQYTAQASDAGDTLQVRILEQANSSARDTFLDSYSVTSIPEPASLGLVGIFGAAVLFLRKCLA